VGGAENYILNLCRKLTKLNNKVVVFTSTKSPRNLNSIKVHSTGFLFKYSNTPINFWGTKLRKVVRKEKPAVIVASLSIPFMADAAARIAKKENIPFFLVYFNDYIKQDLLERVFLHLYYSLVLKKTFSLSKKIIVLSEYYAKKSFVLKPFLDKTVVVPPFVDLNEFKNKNEVKDSSSKMVLFVGALNKGQKYKGLNYLIKAVSILKKEFPEIKLVVVGEGNNMHYFKKLTEKNKIQENVFFAGRVSQEKLLAFYAECSMLVLPSINDSEGFGLVLLEAMAFSKPVVGSNTGGIPAVIKHGFNGLLVEPKNEVKLCKAIEFLLKNKGAAKEMGFNGLKTAKKFSSEKSIRKLMKVFEDALNEKRK
jgi:glycosyltransferase involved in cell wall biosynthesis